MKKILLALFAMTLLVAFTAPADAAKKMKKPAMKKAMKKKAAPKGPSLKVTGLFRIRGISTNNEDQNDNKEDGKQYYENLIRPRITVTSLGGKMTAMWEPDVVVFQQHIHDESGGGETGKAGSTGSSGAYGGDGRDVRTNRWIVNFAVPGSALRMQVGRTDYTSPDGEIFDTGGKSRLPGMSLAGKLSKNISLSMFNAKSKGGTGAENDDQDNYMAALSIKMSPALTLTPWVGNSRNSGGDSYNYWYGALTAQAKVGVFSLNATGVVQEGELSSTQNISAWALLVRGSTSLGKMKLDGEVTILSGDDGSDPSDSGRFRTPRGGGAKGSGWFRGGQIKTAKGPWMSFTNDLRDREYDKQNGAVVAGGVLTYKISKTLSLLGAGYVYQAAESAPTGDDSKDVGSEINVGFSWDIYPGLNLKGVAAYFAAGDYGKVAGKEVDDTWLVGWQLDHKF